MSAHSTTQVIRAARLVRVSTKQQAADDKTSLEVQTRKLTELCEERGWVSLAEDLFVEVISGAKGKANREIFTRLLEEIVAGRYQRLCVLDFDRSTRRGLGEWEEISDQLAKAGCLLVINGQEYDLTDDGAQVTTGILAVVAKGERGKIKKRINRGQEERAKDGWNQGGRVPYGYRGEWVLLEGTHRHRRMALVYEPEAEVVRQIYRAYAEDDKGYQAIANQLNSKGFKGPGGNPFTIGVIFRILTNPTYKGVYVRRRESSRSHQTVNLPPVVAPSKVYPAIVSTESWERVQLIRASRPKYDHGGYHGRRPLTGILRCLGCGGPMYSFSRKFVVGGQERRYWYYRCYLTMKRLVDCPNPQHLRQSTAHAVALETLRQVVAGLRLSPPEPDDSDREGEIRRELQTLALEEERIVSLLGVSLEDGGLRADQFARLNLTILARRDRLEGELGDLQRTVRLDPVFLDSASALLARMKPDDEDLGPLLRAYFREMRMQKLGSREAAQLELASAVLVTGLNWP